MPIRAVLLAVGMTLSTGLLIRGPLVLVILVAAGLGGGWLRYKQHTVIQSPHDLRLIIAERAPIASVEGWIRSPPTTRVRPQEPEPQFSSQVILEVDRIELDGRWIEAVGRISIRAEQGLVSGLHQGNKIQVRGVVKKPPLPLIQGGFDYRQFLFRQRIHYEMRLETWFPRLEILGTDSALPLPARFQSWARRSLALGQPANDAAVRLIWAMALGWRTWLTADARQPFMESGTMHLFAISGLHIALIAALMVVVGKCVGLRRRHAGIVIIPALWLYVLATGSPASAVRAATGSSIVLLGWMLRRPPDTINSIGAAALAILLVQPLQLFQAGFQLSFTVVLSLALLYPKLTVLGQELWQSDLLTPNSEKSTFRLWAVRLAQKAYTSLAVSIAAWLGSLALIAVYFNLMTPISLLANLILVPLAGFALASVLMSLLFAAWWPFISVLANSSAWLWMTTMMNLCERFSDVPGGHFTVPSPSLTLVTTYYLGLLAWIGFKKRAWQVATVLICGAVLIIEVVMTDYRQRQVTTVHLLPVPDGDAIFIDQPGTSDDWMIDGGPLWCRDRFVEPFLLTSPRSANYHNHLITHGDKSHIEILQELLSRDTKRRIIVGSREYRSQFFRQLTHHVEEKGHSVNVRRAPFKIGRWRILHPREDTSVSPADDAVIVLLGQIGPFRVLLLSDLDRSVVGDLLQHDPTLTADIVCLNLPVRAGSPNDFVLRRLDPQLIIVTGSDTPRGESWVQSLGRSFDPRETQLLFTGSSGAIELSIHQSHVQIRTSRGQNITLHPRRE